MIATVTQMIATHPKPGRDLGRNRLEDCIAACMECSQACTTCADACLSEKIVEDLVRCVRLDLDCADMCATTGRMLSRLTAFDHAVARAMLEACAVACRACGDECLAHADMHEHCRVCAEACRRCERACHELLRAMATPADGT